MRARSVVDSSLCRVIAGVAIGLSMFGGGIESAYADAPNCQFSAPGANSILTISVAVTISGNCTQSGLGGAVTKITIALTDPHGSATTYAAPGSNSSNRAFSWQTQAPLNGTYKATVTATGTDGLVDLNGAETSSAVRTFALEVAPAAPSGVAASFDANSRSVNVTWRANSEPDIVRYKVQRAPGSGNFADVAQVSGTSFGDSGLDAGGYRYSVIAVRPGADSTRVVTSSPSSAAEVTVAAQTVAPASSDQTSPSAPAASADPAQSNNPGGLSVAPSPGSAIANPAGGSPLTASGSSRGGPVSALAGALTGPAAPSGGVSQAAEDHSGFAPLLPYAGSSIEAPNAAKSKQLASGTLPTGLLGMKTAGSDRPASRQIRISLIAGLFSLAGLMTLIWIRGRVHNVAQPTRSPAHAAVAQTTKRSDPII